MTRNAYPDTENLITQLHEDPGRKDDLLIVSIVLIIILAGCVPSNPDSLDRFKGCKN